jgi:pimeloyl-ACP methyl ester carboxylesterase
MISRNVLLILSLVALAFPALAQELPTEEPSELTTEAPLDLFARDSYRAETIICPFKGEIEYEPGDIECGLLQVPENREDPDSRFIELHFVKLHSRWGKDDEDEDAGDDDEDESSLPPGKRDDPVIYLTGGPGVKAHPYVERLKDHSLLDYRDLYILEQRGIGYSGDFCPFYSNRKPALDDVATFEESLVAVHERKAECAANARASGVDLAGYSTIENARDVKALRRALGFEKWNVWGISYGSILGQAYVKEDPDGILAVALDAIMPLEIRESELYWRVVHWYNRDLEKLQEICDTQPACAKRYPDMGGRLRAAIQSVVDDPIEVEVNDTEIFPSGKAYFFQDIVAFLPFVFLYEQDNFPAIPSLIYAWADAVERRDMTLFSGLAAAASSGGFVGISQGMSDAVFCLDGDEEAQARAGKKDLQEYPVLGSAIGSVESYERGVRLCLEMGLPQRPAEDYSAVQTSLPTLIIEGSMDPITPPPNAKAILPGFENGTYVEFPYAGHGPSRSVECAGDMLNAFYDNPEDDPDLSCVDEMEEPKMWTPMFLTTLVPKMLALMGEDKKALVLPGAWAGLSILLTLIAFLQLSLASIGRKIDGRAASETGGARPMAWFTSLTAMASIVILGIAVATTFEVSEMLLLFGLVPWASYGAWIGLLAGVLGLLTVIMVIRAKARGALAIGTLIGFLLTGFAAIGLAAFIISWGLSPI